MYATNLIPKEEENKPDEKKLDEKKLNEKNLGEKKLNEKNLGEKKKDETNLDEKKPDEKNLGEKKKDETNLGEKNKDEKKPEENEVLENPVFDWTYYLEMDLQSKSKWEEGMSRGKKMFLVSGIAGYYGLKDLIRLGYVSSGTWKFPFINLYPYYPKFFILLIIYYSVLLFVVQSSGCQALLNYFVFNYKYKTYW